MKEDPKSDRAKSTLIRDFAKTSLGWELAIPIFAGAYLGHLLDKATGSAFIYLLILTFAGIALGYYNLMRHIELEVLMLKIKKKRQEEHPNP
jgi:F0F1-type ATP synthase assembly protein I